MRPPPVRYARVFGVGGSARRRSNVPIHARIHASSLSRARPVLAPRGRPPSFISQFDFDCFHQKPRNSDHAHHCGDTPRQGNTTLRSKNMDLDQPIHPDPHPHPHDRATNRDVERTARTPANAPINARGGEDRGAGGATGAHRDGRAHELLTSLVLVASTSRGAAVRRQIQAGVARSHGSGCQAGTE